jgi:hypothetical protein
MKAIHLLLLGMMLLLAGEAQANLGESPKRVTDRYGGGMKIRLPNPPPKEWIGTFSRDIKSGEYIPDEAILGVDVLRIWVTCHDGKAVCEAYALVTKRELTPAERDKLMKEHGGGRKWKKVKDTVLLEEWTCEDGKQVAVFSRPLARFLIATPEFRQKLDLPE